MARKSTRPKLVLTLEEVRLLEQLRQSRTAAWREVQRAQVLWLYYTGSNIATIMKAVKMTRKSVSKWIAKALTMGVSAGLKDTPHGSKPVLTEKREGLGHPSGLLQTEGVGLRRRGLESASPGPACPRAGRGSWAS